MTVGPFGGRGSAARPAGSGPLRGLREPYRRELDPEHTSFFKAGAEYREQAFIAANRVGKTADGDTARRRTDEVGSATIGARSP